MFDESASAHFRRHRPAFLGLAVALTIWCFVDVYRRGIVDPAQPWLHMTDFTVYTEAGSAFFDGRDPYEVSNIRGWKYLYPPLFALLVAPLHALLPEWQVSVWFALCAAMCFGAYFECRRILTALGAADAGGFDRSAEPDRALPRWLFVAPLLAVLFPALNCLQRGQMGVALLYPLLVGFRLVVTGTSWRAWFAGGVILALPVAFKLTPALPVAALLFMLFVLAPGRRRIFPAIWPAGDEPTRPSDSTWRRPVWSAFGAAAGAALFFLLIPAALVGWKENLRHLHTWHERVASRVNDVKSDDFGGDVASMRNQSLSNAVYRGGNWLAHLLAGGPDDRLLDTTDTALGSMPMDHPAVDRVVFAFRIAALVALLAVSWRAGRAGDLLSLGGAFGLACVATLVFSPVARGHYFVLLLPAALLIPFSVRRTFSSAENARRWVWLAAGVPALLSVLHYVALDFAGRAGVLGIGISIWYFALCGVLLKEPRAHASEQTTLPEPIAHRRAG